jgi:hypothetical protein
MIALKSISRQEFNDFVADCIPAHSLVSTKNIPFVSSNTQARRLGCLLFLLDKIKRGDKTERLLFLSSRSELAELKDNLEAFSKGSGTLTNKISSFQHYLELGESLSILVKQGAVYQLSNEGQLLLGTLLSSRLRPYPLGKATSTYFFQSVFAKDMVGLFPIIRTVLKNEQSGQQILITHYQQAILDMLRQLQQQSDTRSRHALLTKTRDVQKWSEPTSYGEHLVSSKINWLIDLTLIEGVPSSYVCSGQAKSIFDDFLEDIPRNLIDILYLSFRYALAQSDDSSKKPFDETLNSLFKLAGAEANLEKIRIQDAIRLWIAYYPHNFKELALSFGTMAGAIETIARGQFQVQTSQRNSQAYIFKLNPI